MATVEKDTEEAKSTATTAPAISSSSKDTVTGIGEFPWDATRRLRGVRELFPADQQMLSVESEIKESDPAVVSSMGYLDPAELLRYLPPLGNISSSEFHVDSGKKVSVHTNSP